MQVIVLYNRPYASIPVSTMNWCIHCSHAIATTLHGKQQLFLSYFTVYNTNGWLRIQIVLNITLKQCHISTLKQRHISTLKQRKISTLKQRHISTLIQPHISTLFQRHI